MSTFWRVYDSNTVACMVDRDELPGFFRKKIVVGAGEAAIVVRDGRFEDFLTESKAIAAGYLDQFFRSLQVKFDLGADIAVYFVDISTLEVPIFFGEEVSANATREALRESISIDRIGWVDASEGRGHRADLEPEPRGVSIVALSRDNEVVHAECRLRIRVDLQNVSRFVPLLKGKRALATWDIAGLIREDFLARAMIPEIAKHSASDLRTDLDTRHSIEQTVTAELASRLGALGLVLDGLTILWGLTAQEEFEIAKRRAERNDQALDFASKRRIAHLTRERDILLTRQAYRQELKHAAEKGGQELQDLIAAGVIRRELMNETKRIDIAKVDASIAEISRAVKRADEELRLEIKDREFKLDHAARLASIDADDKEMRAMMDIKIKMATEKHAHEMAHQRLKQEQTLARLQMQEKLVAQGLSAGQGESSVLKTMLEQSTEQEFATASDEKVQARAGQKDLETYREAQADERAHQQKMTELSAAMMAAAKQQSPPVVVTGALACSNCQHAVMPAMKFCPSCGTAIR